jgi:preprotein translocase subunit SecD
MRLRRGAIAALTAALITAGCSSSSGGGKPAGLLEARPVIMPAQHVSAARTDPFGSLQVPADEDAYSRLSQTQRAALVDALRHVDCAHPPALPNGSLRVVCDSDKYAYLLGQPLFDARDVTGATPIAPGDAYAQWRVEVSLRSKGADRMWDWTSQHHTDFPHGEYTVNQRNATPPCGANVKTPCSDFLAYLSDDKVIGVPVISDPFKSAVLVAGYFTKASATRLAHRLSR